jgi:flagellar biosynthesis/type III secretory pathway protein FliH
MTLSKQTFKPTWHANPLLGKPGDAPRFLRTQWDEAKAQNFGPWRMSDPVDPSAASTEPVAEFKPEVLPVEPDSLASPDESSPVENQAIALKDSNSIDLESLEKQAFQNGLQEGRAQALAEIEAQRISEKNLVSQLANELHSLKIDSDRLSLPLKKLALHIAEQLVRSELQTSSRIVEELIQQALQDIDHHIDGLLIELNENDLALLLAQQHNWPEGLRFEADPNLSVGSIRVRMHETVIEDLIENRLEQISQQVLRSA